MRLLPVYSYSNQDMYKFIHPSGYNNYFWYYRDVVSKAQTSVINATYKRVVRRTYDFT